MKKLVLIISLMAATYSLKCQDAMSKRITAKCDSILNLLANEKNNHRKSELIISFYYSSIDGFPLLLLELSQKLLVLSHEKNDIMIESAALSAAAQGYRLTGNYVKAMELHRKAISLAEESGDNLLIAFAQNQLGHIYKDRLENNQAARLYKSSLEYARKSKDTVLWFPYMNLGVVFLNQGSLDSSLFYANYARKLIANQEISGNQSIVQSTIAAVYSKKGDLIEARKYFEEAIDVAQKTQSPRYLNSTYVAIAEHLIRNRLYDSAVWYCKRAIDVVNNTALANMALAPARILIDYYQNNNADSTVKYWKVYSVANDSLNNTRTNQQIRMMTFEEEQRKRDVETEKIKYQNKIRTTSLLGGLGVFSLVAFVLYRNNRQKQKANIRLQSTLGELQTTQNQLIQSAKMASLGELTAGIAHEIQNPLNFVNNFSEVNSELIEEQKEALEKGNTDQARTLVDEIAENEKKIIHHGKRADAIVKGMLQHSRTSSGQKELTDINALCDEYLRLSYHGFRAKDKAFNAHVKTEFDKTIEKINIVPQDIGRVILNLINNAFYACTERRILSEVEGSRSAEAERGLSTVNENYEPIVTVTTQKIKDKIEIKVKDNGSGIPDTIKEKIFQPFFTTKPTGQGTGLGLSLAYDIVKAHGGEILVETNQHDGTEFIILLPLK